MMLMVPDNSVLPGSGLSNVSSPRRAFFANLPLASFMCVLWILCHVRSLTMSKRRFESPVFAAFSASLALLSNHCCLSALHLFLTYLSFSLYLTLVMFIVSTSLPADSACNFSFFSVFLPSIAFHVLSVIHLSFFLPLRRPRIVWAAPAVWRLPGSWARCFACRLYLVMLKTDLIIRCYSS